MDEQTALLRNAAERAFECSDRDLDAVHARMTETGVTSVMADTAVGGFGGGWREAFWILFSAGERAFPYPVAASIVAARILSDAGAAACQDILSLAQTDGSVLEIRQDHLVFSGILRNAEFGGSAGRILAILQEGDAFFAAQFPRAVAQSATERTGISGEPRADLLYENVCVPASRTEWTQAKAYRAMALARACEMAGAISAALDLSVAHTRQRKQFGRPLASFQAIQQQLASLAEEAAAARGSAFAACFAADRGEACFEIAAAKLRVNRAAAAAASIAHQVHGAIGFTREYALQKFTRRLWAGQSEYGNERKWAVELGASVTRAGADEFWPALVSGFMDHARANTVNKN